MSNPIQDDQSKSETHSTIKFGSNISNGEDPNIEYQTSGVSDRPLEFIITIANKLQFSSPEEILGALKGIVNIERLVKPVDDFSGVLITIDTGIISRSLGVYCGSLQEITTEKIIRIIGETTNERSNPDLLVFDIQINNIDPGTITAIWDIFEVLNSDVIRFNTPVIINLRGESERSLDSSYLGLIQAAIGDITVVIDELKIDEHESLDVFNGSIPAKKMDRRLRTILSKLVLKEEI